VAYGQTVTAAWDASPPADQVTSYQVCIGTTSLSCNVALHSVSNTQTTDTFAPTGGVIHYVAVRAINASGTGSYSTETTFSIPSFTQPVNQSSPVGVLITPLNLSVNDPDGGTRNFTHTGLPTGLSISATTGQITGTPSAAGTYNVTIFVTDSLVTVSRSFVWTITAPAADTTAPALTITSHTNNQTVSTASVTIAGTATDSGRGGNDVSSVTVNGQAATGGTATGSATASWSRALTLAQGANTIAVQATDNRGNIATQSITLNYSIAPVTGATLTANVASPQNSGTGVTFTAAGSGGTTPRQFKFFVQQSGGSAQMVRDWSTTTTYTWTPTTAASYTVIVWARSAGITVDAAQASAQMSYLINPTPVTTVALSSNVATPQNVGTSVTFTAVGAGGVAPRQYKFLVSQGGGANQLVQDWSTLATYTWTPSVATSYSVTVWARSAGVTTDVAQASAQMAYVINTPPPAAVTGATLTSNVASPQNTGTAITFTASGSGGVAPHQFKFFVQPSGGVAQIAQNWNTATNYAWTPATAGTYTVTVWARSAGVTVDAAQASAQMTYVVNPAPIAPVTSATLTSNVASPQNAGTAITFTANGSGGVAPRQFKFFVQPSGGAAQVAQNWSTAATYTWTPATAATYTVTVWARSAGVTVDAAEASAQMAYVVNPAPIAPVTSATLTSSVASPQDTGTTIGLSATGSGGVGPRQFKFFVQPAGGSAQMLRDWSTSSTHTWAPATAGNYTLIVWVRSAGVTVDAAQASAQLAYVVTTPSLPLKISSLTSNVASPQNLGTSVTFTAAATGGTAPYQFKWWVSDGSSWRVAQDWGSSATFNWVPTVSGDYLVAVWGRSNGVRANSSEALAQVAYTISSTAPTTPLSVTSLTSNLASPQVAGTTVTFTAAATGGTAPYQFKWWVYDGSSWKVAQNWSSSATLNWRPTAAGDYMVAVWARNNGVTLEASQAMGQVFYTITNAPTVPQPAPLTISSLTSNTTSPSMLGTTVTFSATATGGTAPYRFKWWVFDGASWRVGQDWSNSPTFNWRPTTGGDYLVAVWAKSNGVKGNSAEVLAQTAYQIVTSAPTQPLAITSLMSNLASPQAAGTTVTFSTVASGGSGAYEFKWWIFDGTTWKVGQNWSSNSTFNWRPGARGTYIVAVWARNAGVKIDASQALGQVTYIVN
jgi:hypothetical protein